MPRFLSKAQCQHVIDMATKRLAPSGGHHVPCPRLPPPPGRPVCPFGPHAWRGSRPCARLMQACVPRPNLIINQSNATLAVCQQPETCRQLRRTLAPAPQAWPSRGVTRRRTRGTSARRRAPLCRGWGGLVGGSGRGPRAGWGGWGLGEGPTGGDIQDSRRQGGRCPATWGSPACLGLSATAARALARGGAVLPRARALPRPRTAHADVQSGAGEQQHVASAPAAHAPLGPRSPWAPCKQEEDPDGVLAFIEDKIAAVTMVPVG